MIGRRLSRLRAVRCRNGVGGVLVDVIGHVVPDSVLRLDWFVVLERRPGTDHPARSEPGLRCRWAGPPDVESIVSLGRLRAEVVDRFDKGDLVCLLEDDEVPIGFMWFRSHRNDEDGIVFILAPGDIWMYDAFVAPEHRGRRLYALLSHTAMDDLVRRGRARVAFAVDHLNVAGLRGARAFATGRICSVLRLRIGGASLLRLSSTARIRWTASWGEIHLPLLDQPHQSNQWMKTS